MNYLKRLTLIVVILLALVFLLSLFLPSNIKVEKSIMIKASSDLLFKQVDSNEKMSQWTIWEGKDYQVVNVVENQSVNINSVFDIGETKEQILFKELGNEVELTWVLELYFGFNPISKFNGLFIEEDFLKSLNVELNSLKKFVENLPQISSSKVSKQFLSEKQWYLSIRDTINLSQMNNIHGKLYGEINSFMDGNGIVSELAPIVIYHYWSDTLIDIEAGIQVNDSIETNNERVSLNYVASGNVVSATHFGSYDRLPETYFSINEWMRKNEVQVIGPPWEVYITDPALESDPEKWQTQINFPIQ